MAAVPAGTPRLIASDLDGTLLRTDGSVSVRTRRALAALDEAGMQLMLVTARPPRWVDHLADIVGAHGTVICANGAFVYDVPRRTIIEDHGISPATVREIAADMRRLLPGVGFAAELTEGVHLEPEYPELHPDSVPVDAAYGAIDAVDQPVGKLLPGPCWSRRRSSYRGSPKSSALVPTSPIPARAPWPRSGRRGSRRHRHSSTGAQPGESRAATSGPSATCRTTCRCWRGRASHLPWPTRIQMSSRPRATHARRTPTTVWPWSWNL